MIAWLHDEVWFRFLHLVSPKFREHQQGVKELNARLDQKWPKRHDFTPGEVEAQIEHKIASLQRGKITDYVTTAAAREREVYSKAHVLETFDGEFYLAYEDQRAGSFKTGSFKTLEEARNWFLRGGR